jgi:hypothetical protein
MFASELVLEECAAGNPEAAQRRLELLKDLPILSANEEITELAERLVADGPIPARAAGDALHIAFATIYQCDYLLTWNCRHIANAEIQRSVRRLLDYLDLELPVICTPEELMGDSDGAEQ